MQGLSVARFAPPPDIFFNPTKATERTIPMSEDKSVAKTIRYLQLPGETLSDVMNQWKQLTQKDKDGRVPQDRLKGEILDDSRTTRSSPTIVCGSPFW